MNISHKVKGIFSWQIVDAETLEIVNSNAHQNNLVLNQGLDFIASNTFAGCTIACAVGSSPNPPLNTDTGLGQELVRTTSLDLAYAPCSTNLFGNLLAIQRTFSFPIQTQDQQFSEIGWSYSPTAGTNLFSKAQIEDVNGNPITITVYHNQYLRVTYTLQVTISPSVSTANGAIVDGWPTSAGQNQIQYIGLQAVNSNGGLVAYDAGGLANEPSQVAEIFLATGAQSLAPFGSGINRLAPFTTGATATLGNYTSGSYTNYKTATFGRAVTGNYNSMGLGILGNSYSGSSFVEVFNSPQTKIASNQLVTNVIFTWAR